MADAGVARLAVELDARGLELGPRRRDIRDAQRDAGVCRMAFCADFDGNTVILHRRYAEPRVHGTSHRASRELHEAAS